eukprot:2128252-Prorocentrum_lima.AAC.1
MKLEKDKGKDKTKDKVKMEPGVKSRRAGAGDGSPKDTGGKTLRQKPVSLRGPGRAKPPPP